MRFLRLAGRYINPAQIVRIRHHPKDNSYVMQLTSVDGFTLFGSGRVDSEIIEIDKKSMPADYQKLQEYLEKNSD